jgi:hypothetical protein
LLKHGQIRRFLRTSGWAVVGQDPIRSSSHNTSYQGFERRLAA